MSVITQKAKEQLKEADAILEVGADRLLRRICELEPLVKSSLQFLKVYHAFNSRYQVTKNNIIMQDVGARLRYRSYAEAADEDNIFLTCVLYSSLYRRTDI